MDDTMRDILSKLDKILLETTLQDLKRHPLAKDPEIADAISDQEEKEEGVEEANFPGASDVKMLGKQKLADSDQELYGLRLGDTVRVEIEGREEQGDIIDIYPETMEVELLLRGPEAGRTVTVDVRDVEYFEDIFQVGDEFGISLSEDFEIGTEIVDILEDGIVIELDDRSIEYLTQQGLTFSDIDLSEAKKKGVDGKACWKGYRYAGREKKADGSYKDKCVKVGESLDEAEYQGREVPLGKPMKGDVKKSKVYVKNAKGNVVKVNFGDKDMRIKKSNPKRRKSFRARHNCANPGPRWKARYWSCRAW